LPGISNPLARRFRNSLNPEPLQELSGWLFDLTNQWEQRLNKLDSMLSKEKKDSGSYKSQSRKRRKNA